MRGLNKVTLIGNLGKDPEIQRLEGKISVAEVSLATAETFKNRNGQPHTETEWHSGAVADFSRTGSHLHKGNLVYVEGKLKTRQYRALISKLYRNCWVIMI